MTRHLLSSIARAHSTRVLAPARRAYYLARLFACALASLALASAPVSRAAADPPGGPPADPTARAEWLSSQAETAFAEKRFADAIRLYLDAWEASPAASILYNVAFIYDKRLNDPELAIDYYDRAARSADADDDLKGKARARIAALRAERAGDKPPPDKPPPDKPPPDKRPPPEPAGGGSVGPWVVAGSGGALLLGGAIMGLIASSTESDFQDAESAADKRALQDQGRTEALVADILMGTGIVAIGAGVVWMILDASSEPGEARVTPLGGGGLSLEPRFIRGGAALSVGGSF